jgi:ribose transport system substrate-binding protein
MNSDRIRSGTTLVVVALLVAACSSSGGGTSPAASAGGGGSPAASASGAGEKPYIPVISKGFQHQFWQAVKQGAESKAAELNVTVNFQGPENESQVDKQMEMLQAELDKNPAAVCFAALDSQAAVPLLQQFKDKNIPVIGFDSGVDSDIPVTTAATDNIKAAGTAADKLGELIGGSGKVGLIVHDQTSRTGIDRRDGFVNEMKAKAMIQGNPDIKGFFGANEGSAIGVVNAVNELNKSGQLVVVGYDSGKAQIDAINSGLMAGAITQNPIGIGEQCVDAAVKAINGETLPKNIDTGFYWYDKTNINDAEIKAVLYE